MRKGSRSFLAGKSALLVALTMTTGLSAGLMAGANVAMAETVTRDVSGFSSVRLLGGFQGTIEVSDKEGLSISGEDNVDERVFSEVSGEELRINLTNNKRKNDHITLKIDARTLERFVVEGAADFEITGIKSEDFEVRLPGAGKVSLEGTCGNLEIMVQGAAHIDAKDLKCKTGHVKISGTGTISLYTTEEVDARISGIGKISIYGEPKVIDKRISGLGKIETR